jgi:hypothetical protein
MHQGQGTRMQIVAANERLAQCDLYLRLLVGGVIVLFGFSPLAEMGCECKCLGFRCKQGGNLITIPSGPFC